MALLFRRGLEADRTSITPVLGEPIVTTDELKLFLGDGSTPGGVPVSADLNQDLTADGVFFDLTRGVYDLEFVSVGDYLGLRPRNDGTLEDALRFDYLNSKWRIGDNQVWHEGSFTPSSYLAKSGGTLTGAVEFDAPVAMRYNLEIDPQGDDFRYVRVTRTLADTSVHDIGLDTLASGATRLIRRADGSSANILTLQTDGVFAFNGELSVNGNTVYHEGNLTPSGDDSATGLTKTVYAVATIAQGDLVSLVGSAGAYSTAEPADNTTHTNVAGIATENIANGTVGTIQVGGTILEGYINTSGLTAGNPIWLGTSGAVTDTLPTGADEIIRVGTVGVIAPSNGSYILDLPAFAAKASETVYDNTDSGLTATHVKAAIDEVALTEKVAGGSGFISKAGAVVMDFTEGDAFHYTMTGNWTSLALSSTPSGLATEKAFTLVIMVDATGGYTVSSPFAVTWLDGSSWGDLDLTANAVNIMQFVNIGTTVYGALVYKDGVITLEPYVLSFADDGSQLVVVTQAETLDLGSVTNVEAGGTAGTGTLAFEQNGGAATGVTSFVSGDVLKVTLSGSGTPTAVSIPRVLE